MVVWVITVPHACPEGGRRQDPGCDAAAVRYAMALARRLVPPPVMFIPDADERDRKAVDPNRRAGRAHPMRRRLRRWMVRHMDENVYIIDVHSFEYDTPRFIAGKPWGAFPVIALDDGNAAWFSVPGIPVVRGLDNDIQDEALEFGFRSILIEFNEAGSSVESLAQALMRI